jgi:Trp operon repressor
MNTKASILVAAVRLDATKEVLRLTVAGRTVKETATRAELLAWLLKCSPCATQRDLAKRLGVSEGRCSQMLKVFRRHYGSNSAMRLTSR